MYKSGYKIIALLKNVVNIFRIQSVMEIQFKKLRKVLKLCHDKTVIPSQRSGAKFNN